MNKEILKMQMTDLNIEILSDLKKDLAEEKSKPASERDESYIFELEEMIGQTEEEILSESQARSLDKSLRMLDEYNSSRKVKLFKYSSVITAVIIVILGLNIASMKVFGQNMFSAAYKLTKGGVTISNNTNSPSDNLFVSPSDPYGMKAKCAAYGFFPSTPSYIPDGFELKSINEDKDEYSDLIIFMYRKENMILNFYYTNYKIKDEIPSFSIPTDTYNVTEKSINGREVYILMEDKQYTAEFTENSIRSRLFAENLDYKECEKILGSMS